MSELEMGTVYDLNKQLVQKEEKALSNSKLREKKKTIISFTEKKDGNYFMLLCNERKDYTVFNFISGDKKYEKLEEMTNILVDECLKNRGEIRAIDITQDKGAIEIWLLIDEEAYCYYFFPCDQAIIEIL